MAKYIDADRLKQTIADNVYPVQDAFNRRDYGMFWTSGIEKAIDEQPAADIPWWIPVTERVPEEDYETGNGVQFSADVLATIVNHKNDGELYVWLLKTVNGKWYDYIPNTDRTHEVPYWCEVIAWMPLPEPYREEGGKQ